MKKLLTSLFYLGLLGIACVVATFALSQFYLSKPGPLTAETTVIIAPGTRSLDTAKQLAAANVITLPEVFFATQYARQNTRKFKAGEYAFAPGTTPAEVARKLVAGEVVIHKITVPEGWRSSEIKALLQAETSLTGDITTIMPEGSLLPETYYFTRGETRDAVVGRMKAALQKTLDAAWEKRAQKLPINSKEEALILASIVEKETGVADERPRVAAVFVNRLRIGMRLQTDPTVVYGIEMEKGEPMGRALTYADLEKPTPYNTYVNPGLPPAPIANPGKASIEAALNPLATDEFYFVATGTGGHAFAKTLDGHNANVQAYRELLKTQ